MVTAKRTARPLGVILHRGYTPTGNQPYVVIMPLGKSSNGKTGKMLQTYIIRSDIHPVEAVQKNADDGICFNCPMRGLVADAFKRPHQKPQLRTCYVNVGQGPAQVYKAYQNNRYVTYEPVMHDQFIHGRKVRFGTYGEPVLIPIRLVEHLASLSDGWTGYTHQWSNLGFSPYRRYFMASVHSLAGPWSRAHAKSLGWRTFRTDNDGTPADGEVTCPASAEAGKRLSCEQCKMCDGEGVRSKGLQFVDIHINAHGGPAIMSNVRKLPVLQTS